MKKDNEKENEGLSRRDFLVKGGIVFGGSLIMFQTGCAPIQRSLSKFTTNFDLPSGVKEDDPTFWFEVLPDNTVKMVMPKTEMGQGVFTGFGMIAAEELDVKYEQLKVVPSTSMDPLDTLGTGGSSSTTSMYSDIREVAAKMRLMLVMAVAEKWEVDEETLTVSNGVISNGTKEITYAKVVEIVDKWKIPNKVKLKSSADFKIIGTDVKRNDLLEKVTGAPIFGVDKSHPDMVYGMFVQSPILTGKPKSVDTTDALKVQGVIRVVEEDDFIAVVASNRYAAEMGARAVKVNWEAEEEWTQEKLTEWVKVGNGSKGEIMKKGHAKRLIKKNKTNYHTTEYRTPPGAHAQMEPNGSIAHYENGKVKITAGIQTIPLFQKQVAKRLKIKSKDVFIENAFLGGGFGRKSFYQDIAKVAHLSKIIGKPVHVFGDRTQEFQNGYLRPATHHTFEVQQDDTGKILALDYQIATDNMLLTYYPKIAEKILGGDPASSHGARVGYSIKHVNTTYWKTKMPFRVGSWRGVGMFANTFAIESLMDELAHKAKIDPLDFRLMHLTDGEELHERQRKLLKKLRAEKVWGQAKKDGIGIGMACAEDRKTMVASVVEVSIKNDKIKVEKITTIMDAGKIVNPEGVRQQVEGCAIMGLGATLKEKIEIKDNAISATNFHQYSVPTIDEIPEINVLLMESEEHPLGVGEPPIAPISAAIANAVFDLTGKRLRILPLELSEVSNAENKENVMVD